MALAACAVVFFIVWSIGEPARRARRIRATIRPAMSVEDVEKLLSGRHVCLYDVMISSQWTHVSREQFAALAHGGAVTSPPLRMTLYFLGMSPARSGLSVSFSPRGKVERVTELRPRD